MTPIRLPAVSLTFLLTALIAASATLPPQPAKAADSFPVISSVEGNYVGFALGVLPDYMGSNDYTWGALPAFRHEFGNHRNVELIGNYLSANLIDHDVIRLGPAARYRFGRDSDVEDDAVKRLPKIDDAVELGLTASANWILKNDPRNRLIVGADALKDVSNTSDGLNYSVFGRYWIPVSQAVDLGFGASLRYGDSDFNNTYFGVSAAGAAASGLRRHDAGSGINQADGTLMGVFHLNADWHIGFGGRYSRILADAADSPIVADRGNENQFLAGIGLIYTWGSKVNTR